MNACKRMKRLYTINFLNNKIVIPKLTTDFLFAKCWLDAQDTINTCSSQLQDGDYSHGW